LTRPIDSEEAISKAVVTEALPLKDDAQLTAGLRDLIVHLHQGNKRLAGALVDRVATTLNNMMPAEGEAPKPGQERLNLTIAAIGEARLLMNENDMWGAATAARDAAREWRAKAGAEIA